MDQQLLEDTIHELAARDRYMLTSAEACMQSAMSSLTCRSERLLMPCGESMSLQTWRQCW